MVQLVVNFLAVVLNGLAIFVFGAINYLFDLV